MENNANKKISLGNKIFFIIFFLILFSSVGITFLRLVVLKDYQIIAETSCDPKVEKCFVFECDPASDTACSQNLDERISYYKKISKKAGDIYACEHTVDKIGCNGELACLDGEKSCSYTLCDPANLGDGEKCSE